MILHTKLNTTHAMTHLKKVQRLAETLITIVSNPASIITYRLFQKAADNIISNESTKAPQLQPSSTLLDIFCESEQPAATPPEASAHLCGRGFPSQCVSCDNNILKFNNSKFIHHCLSLNHSSLCPTCISISGATRKERRAGGSALLGIHEELGAAWRQ